jgi:dethiobiotin synthetase
MQSIFITGIGTGVGKTLVSAIITEALHADYWKPVQAGLDGTDTLTVESLVSNSDTFIHPELYRLQTPASPHIAAKTDGIMIDHHRLTERAKDILQLAGSKQLVIEGAGGLLVPLTRDFMVADLIRSVNAKLIIVSRNYLGSINHSLLTAAYCKNNGIDVAGWIFNDDYMNYEEEIVGWSGYPALGSIPKLETINTKTVLAQAARIRPQLTSLLYT